MCKVHVIVRQVNREYIMNNFDLLLASLYPVRQEQVKKFRNKEAACVSIAAGMLLQEVAFKKLGIEPSCLVVKAGEHGKPYIEGCESFCFNLSHSGDYVVIAYGDEPVGIDIERIKDGNGRVAKRCFTDRELRYVQCGDYGNDHVAADTETERFCVIWTMKESYLKLTGQGISVPLNSFTADAANMVVEGTDYHFNTRRYENYYITVCTQGIAEVVTKINT